MKKLSLTNTATLALSAILTRKSIIEEVAKEYEAKVDPNRLDERERLLLEKKSQILRLYLLKNVMPHLTKGILKVTDEMPENPVEMLGDFLIEESVNFKKDDDNYFTTTPSK